MVQKSFSGLKLLFFFVKTIGIIVFLFVSSSGAQRAEGLQGPGGDPAARPPELGGSRARWRKSSDRLPGGETGRVPQDLGQGMTSTAAFHSMSSTNS